MFKTFIKYPKTICSISLGTICTSNYYYQNRLPYYTYNDISQHNNINSRIWTSHKNYVYDITDFIDFHPGGKDKIMLAAGNQLDPYWDLYTQHLDQHIIKNILEPMKIGYLKDYDPNKNIKLNNDEPIRDNKLLYHNMNPCNAETVKNLIMDNWITPNHLWYIRNSGKVPKIKDNYKININGLEIKLEDIKHKFTKNEIITTIQCCGNRRKQFNQFKKTNGTSWNYGAISTAKWGGVWLKDLLLYYNFNLDNNIKYIIFESIDSVKISIPIEKVLDPLGNVMLAYQMNDEDLPRDHGYPLRLIVPGYVGIRNLKWIKNISFSDKEAEGPWQSGLLYKIFKNEEQIKDIKNISSILEIPIQCVIVQPSDGDVIKNSTIEVKGFALSGNGRGILKVEVSIDGGKTWKDAKLVEGSEQKSNQAWAWTFWNITFYNNIQQNNNFKIICRATDVLDNKQPPNYIDIWNIRGLNNNSWHTINILY